MKNNLLENAYQKAAECREQKRLFWEKLILSSEMVNKDTFDIQHQIEILELKYEVYSLHIKRVEYFIKHMLDIKLNPNLKEINDEECYEYFRQNLKPYEFDYLDMIETCDICSKAPTKKNGVVTLIHNNELVNMCAKCHQSFQSLPVL